MTEWEDAEKALLDATIEHLESLKAHGTRFVSVSKETLEALNAPVRRIRTETRGSRIEDGRKQPVVAAQPQSPALAIPRSQPSTANSPLSNLPTSPISPPKSAEPDREAAFADLRRRALACVKCSHLAKSRKNVVFGVGSIYAELMFVGEAPGADEDTQGEPFVGKAGQLLTKIIETMGLQRDSVYIANILKCRPDTPGQEYGNRKPTPEEMQTCIPFLHEQIDLIKPKVLVALGATAVEGLLNKTGINRLRGNWQIYRGTPLMPTFHPAYLLRSPNDKRKVWEDMLQVMEKLGLPISERQRGFFSKAG